MVRQYIYHNFDAYRLWALGEMDLRMMAAQNPALSAMEYFARVQSFFEQAPVLLNALTGGEQSEQQQALVELDGLLTAIGCCRFGEGLAALHRQWQSGELAAGLPQLCGRIQTARSASRRHAQEGEAAEMTLSALLSALEEVEDTRKLRVLAVDDVAVVLNSIVSILSPHYEVYAVKNSAQVLQFLSHTTPELFLLDIEMPDKSGFELVPVIRDCAGHQNTPIIFITGSASLDNLKEAVALGACDFISKPINREILLEKIEKNIVRKRAF